jgi:hypothetical protein
MNLPFDASQYSAGIAVLILWSAFWKGLGLYKAIKNDQMWWFVLMFIVNLAGLLEILYLFRFAKKRMTLDELAFWKSPQSK